MSSAQSVAETRKRKNLNDAERSAVIAELLRGSNNGVLRRGDLIRVAAKFGTNPRTVANLWKEYGRQKADGVVCPDLRNKRRGKSGRKGIDVEALRERLKKTPVDGKTTLRVLADALGIPKSTLQNNLKRLGLRAASRHLKRLPDKD